MAISLYMTDVCIVVQNELETRNFFKCKMKVESER